MKKSTIGGQAVIEGVMMRGQSSMALAVRDEDGLIRLETKRIKPQKERSFLFRIPVVRGVLNFGITLVDGVKTLTRSADVFGEAEPTPFEKWMADKLKINVMSIVIFISLFLGLAFAISLFILLPNWLSSLITTDEYQVNLYSGLIKVVVLFCYLYSVSFMKDIRRTFKYHGAEHKTISCYEKGLDLTVENAQSCSTLHNRCGTTFMFFVILVGVALSLIIPVKAGLWQRICVRILTLPLVAGLAYELLKLLAKTDFFLLYPLKLPGLLLQKITTKQPTDDMVEVAITAFETVLKMDADPSIPEVKFDMQKKYPELFDEIKQKYLENNLDDFSSIDFIACSVLKVKRSELKNRIVSPKKTATIRSLTDRVIQGEPMQYILTETDFYGYNIKLNNSVLIPRFETELVTEATYLISQKITAKSILDICTGSGCIAIALAHKTSAKIVASDISSDALSLAQQNAKNNNVQIDFIESDMFENIDGKFDIIVSNPPYIKTADIPTLEPVVKDFEPTIALDGGEDGLKFYRIIAENADKYLNKNGYLVLELGINQKAQVQDLLGNYKITIYKDYSGIDRILVAKKVK